MPTAFKQIADNAISTTVTNLHPIGVTSLTLRTGDGAKFPQPGNGFYITLWNSILYPSNAALDPNMEKCLCTARSGDALTISPTTKTHGNNCTVALLDISQNTKDIQAAINNLETASGSYPYELTANKGMANGYAPLNNSSAVPVANLPAASTSSYGVIQLAGDLGGTAASPTTPTAVHITGAETIAGVKTFSSSPIVPNATTSSQTAAFGQIPTSASSIGGLLASNNLSDVTSATASFSNIKQSATTGVTGVIKLSGDLAGTASSPYVNNALKVYNLFDPIYGVVHDGSTDDRVAIQAVIDSAHTAGGGRIYAPKANYYISPTASPTGFSYPYYGLKLYDNVTVFGDGKKLSVFVTGSIPNSGPQGYFTMFRNNDLTGGNTNILIDNIGINLPTPLYDSGGLVRDDCGAEFIGVSNTTVTSVWINNGTIGFNSNTTYHDTANALTLGGSNNNVISYCQFDNVTGSLAFTQSTNCHFIFNRVNGAWDDAFIVGSAGTGHRILNNYINAACPVANLSGSYGSIYILNDNAVGGVDAVSDIVVDGNTILNNNQHATSNGLQSGITLIGPQRDIIVNGNDVSSCTRGVWVGSGTKYGVHINKNKFHGNTDDGIRIEANLTSNPVTGLRIIENDVWNNTGLGIHLYSNDVLDATLIGNHCYDDQGSPTQTTSLYMATESGKTMRVYEWDNDLLNTTPLNNTGAGASGASFASAAYNNITSTLTNSTFTIQPASGSYLIINSGAGNLLATFNAGEGSGIAAYKGTGVTYPFSVYNSADTTTLALRVDGSSNLQVLGKLLGLATGSTFDIQPGTSSYLRLLSSGGNLMASINAGEGSAIAAFKGTGATYPFSVYSSADTTTLALRVDGSGHTNISDAKNVILGTSTGTKFGTATNQKLAFYNATPIVQPSGDIITALINLGLITSPTISESDITNLTSDLALKAPLASPTFTGTPAAPTASIGTNTTQLATTAFVLANSFTNPMTTLGDTTYGGAAGAATRLPGNTSTTKQFLTQTGTGSASAAPVWGMLAAGDIPNIAESQVTNLVTDLAARLQLGGDINGGTAIAPQVTGLHLSADTSIGHKLTNVTDPTSAQDAATKNYVDNIAQGLSPKASVRVATTGSETLTIASGSVTQISGTTVDGVSPSVNDRILIKDAPASTGAGSANSTQPGNGIYVVTNNSTNLSLSRATDMDDANDLPAGAYTLVEAGTTNSTASYVVSTPSSNAAFTYGTNNIAWTQFNGAADVTAGSGLTKSGNTISVTTGGITNAMLAGSIAASKLVGTDIATVGTITSGTWTGTTIAIANGGTGATTQQAAIDALTGTQSSGKVLRSDGTHATLSSIQASDVPTLNQNTTGSAAILTTARAVYGNNFDGSAALAQIIASTFGGTGNGFTKFSGPASSEKTFTLPNASATILTDNALVTVAQGGTGVSTSTGTGNVVLSASPTFTGTVNAAAITTSGAESAGTMAAGTTTLSWNGIASIGVVAGAKSLATSGVPANQLTVVDTTSAAAGVGGGITFIGNYSGTTASISGAIDTYKTNSTAGNYSFGMRFMTRTNGAGTLIEVMRLTEVGLVGIGTNNPTNLLSLGGQSAQIFWMERETTANTAGNSLSVISGGATSGATDKGAGDLILRPGLSTGQGGANVRIQTMTRALSTGTGDNTATDRIIVQSPKSVTNNSATTIASMTLASGSIVAGRLSYVIEVTDGTDYQYESGFITYGVTNKAGTIANNSVTKFGNQQAVTSGTLTVTFTITAANPALIQVNANSSLTPSTGYPRVTFIMDNLSQQAVTIS